MTRYIGLDAHSESCTIAVLGGSGKRLRHERLQTSAELLKNFIKGCRGRGICSVTHSVQRERTQLNESPDR